MQIALQATSPSADSGREVAAPRRRRFSARLKDVFVGTLHRVWRWNPACHLWVWLAIALTVKAVVEPVLHSTYPCFEAGTRCWWAGQDMYNAAVCRHDYRYGPAFAVAMTPLALLPTWLGGMAWSWLSIGAFFCSLRALARQVLPGRWTRWREAAFLALVLLGSLRMFWAAQSNPLVFAMIAGAVVAIQRRRWWWAALLLAMPVHIKVWPIAAAMLLIACRPRQLAWRFAVGMAAVAAVPFLAKPAARVCHEYYNWYCLLVGPAQIRHMYRDAWTIWELTGQPVSPRGYLLLQLGAALAVLGLCLQQVRRKAPTAELLTCVLALWTAWQLEFGPGTERNTFGLLAPLSAWAVLSALEAKRGRLLIGISFLLTTAASFGIIERALVHSFPVVLAAHPLGVLLFAGWLLGWISQRREQIVVFSARAVSETTAVPVRGSALRMLRDGRDRSAIGIGQPHAGEDVGSSPSGACQHSE